MPFFNATPAARQAAKSNVATLLGRSLAGAGKPEAYGWYDSSFDLLSGLEVTEQDNDTMFQLWQLAQG